METAAGGARRRRGRRAVPAGVGALGLALALGTTAPALAAPLPGVAEAASRGGFGLAGAAAALGSRVSGNPTVGSGRTAASYLCTATFPRRSSNEVAGTQERTKDVLELGAVTTSNRAGPVRGRRGVTSISTIASGSLLGGVVTFDGLRSFSQVRRTPNGFDVRRESRLASLRVAGVKIPLDPGAGTRTVPIPLLGELTFNASGQRVGKRRATAFTEALRIDLNDGTRIQLGRSKARLDVQPDGVFRGGAWGTEADVAGLVGSGRTGFAPLPCAGTNGKVRTNTTLDLKVPGVVEADVTRSAVRTRRLRAGRADAVATNRVAGVNLGGGALRVDVVKAKARIVRDARGRVVRRVPSSQVGVITAAGTQYTLPVGRQVLEIPGVATLESGLVTRKKRGLSVVALRVTLLEAGGTPAVVDLGVATVTARR